MGSSCYGRWLETGAAAFAQLGSCFTFAPGLGRLVMLAAAGLGQDTFLLHFAAELFECDLKRAVGVNNDLRHGGYQRDLPEPVRCPLRGWD